MQLTAQQVGWLNSPNPSDNALLLQSLGGDEVLLHKLNNMFGPGGQYYDPKNYGFQSGAQEITGKSPEALAYMLANGQAEKGADGKYYVPGTQGNATRNFSAIEVDPNTGWSGVNAAGGFTGGTGTGITTPGVTVNANGTYSPVTAQSLMAAMGGGTSAASGVAGGGTQSAPGSGIAAPGIGIAAPGSVASTSKAGEGGSIAGRGSTGATTGSITPGGALPTAAVSGNPMDYFDDAGYKFRLKEGQDAINNTAAARGNALSGPAAKAGMQYASDLASQEYGNAFNRMTNARDYTEGVRRYDTTFGENRRQFDAGLGENQRQFDEGTRRWGLNFDQNVATSDRDFNEGVRRFDLTTNLGQANNDRAFSYGTLKDLATLGLGGANSSSDLSKTLAQLLTGGTLAGGGALAGGTIGGANATNSMASQLLNLIFGNNLVSSLQPKP